MQMSKERENGYLKSLGINPDDIADAPGFLNTLCKIRERTELDNPVEKFVIENHGVIDQWFIPPERFSFSGRDDPYSNNMIASVAFGYRYGGVQVVGDNFMFEQILNGDVLTELPRDWVDKLPGWTVEFPISFVSEGGEERDITQFISRRRVQGKDCLVLSLFNGFAGESVRVDVVEIIDVGNGFVSFRDMYEIDHGGTHEAKNRMLAATLFICSLIPHHPAPTVYAKSKKKKTKSHYHIQPKSKPTVISTLKAQETYLEEYGTDTKAIQVTSRKAHMRRAHWQSFWIGPRDGERKKILKWIPPTFVRGFLAV